MECDQVLISQYELQAFDISKEARDAKLFEWATLNIIEKNYNVHTYNL